MSDNLIDRIYEAAFVPEFWPSVLKEIAERADAASGEFQVIADGEPPRWRATEITHDALDSFMQSGLWRACERPQQFLQANHAGFLRDVDVMTPEQIERDPVRQTFDSVGLGWQLGTLIPMATGEIVGLTFERWLTQGRPSIGDVAALDELRPHLARSALVAARLRLERAATEMGIGFGSARTYLARIFGKTGTNQQSQLVALLKSTQPLLPQGQS